MCSRPNASNQPLRDNEVRLILCAIVKDAAQFEIPAERAMRISPPTKGGLYQYAANRRCPTHYTLEDVQYDIRYAGGRLARQVQAGNNICQECFCLVVIETKRVVGQSDAKAVVGLE